MLRFGPGALRELEALLAASGFSGYVLVSTERALADAPRGLVEAAEAVLHVPAGPVPEAAGAVREGVAGRPLVAFGGGRVIDSAKAVAGADGLRVAAVPTTLSGAPFTPFHRMPAGVDTWRLVRPALAVCDPALMASQPLPGLAASAMNSLAHATEALYAPAANPVAEGAALRAAALFAAGLGADDPDRPSLALASLLAGYAVGVAGLSVHHAVCQTIVRTLGTPHAETNAVVLPHSARLMAAYEPEALGELAAALGHAEPAADAAGERIAALAQRAGATRLRDLGVEDRELPAVARAARAHPALAAAPVGDEEVEGLLRAAL